MAAVIRRLLRWAPMSPRMLIPGLTIQQPTRIASGPSISLGIRLTPMRAARPRLPVRPTPPSRLALLPELADLVIRCGAQLCAGGSAANRQNGSLAYAYTMRYQNSSLAYGSI